MFVYLKNIRVENAPISLDYGIILNMYVSCTETQTDWKKAGEQINEVIQLVAEEGNQLLVVSQIFNNMTGSTSSHRFIT